VQGGDVLLAVRAVGRAATVYSDPFGAPVAQIAMTTPSPWTDTSMPTYIEFSTTPTSTITPAVAMKIDHNGNVGIGTTGPLAKLEVVGGLGLVVGAPTGGALAAGKINAIEVRANNVVLTSDAELKTDIAPLPACLPLLAAIEPKTFRWLPLPEPDPIEGPAGEMVVPQTGPVDFAEKLNRGFLAQEVAEAIGGKAADGVDLGGMVAILWQAVRELSDRVNELEGDKPAPRH
jgi:hypothetical protein